MGYLPKGAWRCLWTDTCHDGPVLLRDVPVPLDQVPVYVADPVTSQVLGDILPALRGCLPVTTAG